MIKIIFHCLIDRYQNKDFENFENLNKKIKRREQIIRNNQKFNYQWQCNETAKDIQEYTIEIQWHSDSSYKEIKKK